MLFGMNASATVTAGDQFVYNWAETSPNPSLSGTADITLGAATATPGFFSVSSFSVFQTGGFCGVCTPVSENLSAVSFDGSTLGLVGNVTGSFLGSGGGTHTFGLITTDLPGGMWTFNDLTVVTNTTQTSMGTYTTTATAVDEPAILALLVPAGVGVLASFMRRRRRVSP
jgi:hypothetical protein